MCENRFLQPEAKEVNVGSNDNEDGTTNDTEDEIAIDIDDDTTTENEDETSDDLKDNLTNNIINIEPTRKDAANDAEDVNE